MKKVVILTGPLAGHGGEETVICNFVNLLGDSFEFELIISENSGDIEWIKNISKNLAKFYVNDSQGKFKKLLFIFNSLRKSNSRVVICLTPKMAMLAKAVKIIFSLDYDIVTWMQFSLKQKFNKQTIRMLKLADYHMAINSGIKNGLMSIGIPQDKIYLVYNPVIKQDRFIKPAKQIKKIICISRVQFSGEKNISELIKGLCKLKDKEEWVLELYGADDSINRSETMKLKHLIYESGLSENVKWYGFKKNIWNYIDEANCLVLTSKAEGFGMVLCEAISFGIPVVSSNCPSGPADIVNDENGYLYQMGNLDELSVDIQKIISGSAKFNPDSIKSSIDEMYEANYKKRIIHLLGEI